jgi:hypothetical protein
MAAAAGAGVVEQSGVGTLGDRNMCVTPCMPCSFGLLPHRRSGTDAQPQRPASSDRECPLDTAGVRCLWHAGGTAGENDNAPTRRQRLPAGLEARLVLGDQCIVGKSPKGSRQPGRRPELEVTSLRHLCPGGCRKRTCGFCEHRPTTPARCCPSFTRRLQDLHDQTRRFLADADPGLPQFVEELLTVLIDTSGMRHSGTLLTTQEL